MADGIIERCAARGLRLTGPRKVIAQVLEASADHPDAVELHERVARIDPRVSLATVYRTVKLFDSQGILDRVDFGDGRARWETADRAHHDHLIDNETGQVIEFVDAEIETLQERIARRLGYRLTGHRMELYGEKLGEPERLEATAKKGLTSG